MSDDENTDNERKHEREVDIALQRYGIIMAHLRYDQTIFWTRIGLMTLIQLALLGYFIESTSELGEPRNRIAALSVCFAGLALVWLFNKLRAITHYWIDHWIKQLNTIEEIAFGGDITMLSIRDTCTQLGSARKMSQYLIRAIFGAWILAIVVILVTLSVG